MLKNVVVSFILICLIFAISFAEGEIYDLEGWVKYQNNEPASGVTMSIGKYYIETDQNGYYKFTLLWPGEHVISISPPKISTRSVKVIIKENYPYQIEDDSNIQNIEGDQLLDNSQSSIAITSEGNNLYQIRRGGEILQYTGTAWEQLDNTSDNNYGILFHKKFLYKILQNGEIQKYNPDTENWERLEHDPTWEQLEHDPTWEQLEHDPTTYAFFTNREWTETTIRQITTDSIPKRNIVIVRKDFLIDW
jgi:hypothetical protein